jgi:hypothetical protein
MKTFIKSLIGIGLLLLAGNATAMMISGKSDIGPVTVDMSMDEIYELLQSYQPGTKKEKKYSKKADKKYSKINKSQSKLDGSTSDKKAAKLVKKIEKKEQKLAALLRKMNLDLSAYLTSEISPAVTDIGNFPGEDTSGDQPGNDTRNVPEPSVLALLAIGLIGFGATRFRRQSA